MLIFDIETDGLLDTVTKIHSLVILNTETNKLYSLHGTSIGEGIDMLHKSSEILCGHNIIAFDVPAIERLYGITFNRKLLRDTLVCARIRFPEVDSLDAQLKAMNRPFADGKLRGKHSLKAWGYRIGALKGTFGESTDWKLWTPEMQTYCEQDVEVTEKLVEYLKIDTIPQKALELEHAFADYIAEQERNGCPFNEKAAKELYDEVRLQADKFHLTICSSIPDKVIETVFTPKVNSPKFGYRKGVPVTKIERVPFNPSSRTQIIELFKNKYQWEPKEFTEKGTPEINDDVLRELPYKEAQMLADLFEANKLLGQLGDGKNAWLKLVKNGKLHGYVNPCGAITTRCTHSNPNLGQVPSVGAFKGKECRSLFYSPNPDYRFVGGDASGLELRMLAHYLFPFDNGKYAEVVVNGDIHTLNMEAAGLKTRAQAKTFIYAFLYGAGDAKLGYIVDPLATEIKAKQIGAKLRASFMSKVPAMALLTNAVKDAFKRRGYIIALDGRILKPRAAHSALNTLLQSAGAILMKESTNVLHSKIKGLDVKGVLHIHDEVQLIAHNSIAEDVGKMIPVSIQEAGKILKLKCPVTGEYRIGNNWADTH